MFFLERPPYSFVLPSAVGEKPPSKGHHLCIHENLAWKNGISRDLPKHCNSGFWSLRKGPFKKMKESFFAHCCRALATPKEYLWIHPNTAKGSVVLELLHQDFMIRKDLAHAEAPMVPIAGQAALEQLAKSGRQRTASGFNQFHLSQHQTFMTNHFWCKGLFFYSHLVIQSDLFGMVIQTDLLRDG